MKNCFFHSLGGQATNGSKLNGNGNSNGADGLDTGIASDADLDDDEMNNDPVKHSPTLKIDKNLVPVDLRLHGYLSNLAKVCFDFSFIP